MEKMDSESRCQHPRKVFAAIANGFAMMADPPIRECQYICQDCGYEGIGIMLEADHQPTYHELRQKKARGGFGRGR